MELKNEKHDQIPRTKITKKKSLITKEQNEFKPKLKPKT
jgi:hypothetical protein